MAGKSKWPNGLVMELEFGESPRTIARGFSSKPCSLPRG